MATTTTTATTVTCPNCGTKNRIRSQPEGVPRCAKCHQPLPWVVEATAETYDEELRASVPVLVDFWAAWCGPCRMVTPVVEKLAAEFAGRMKVVKLDVDAAPSIAARYDVQGIPLLVLHRDGKEIARQVGAVPEGPLRSWLTPYVATSSGQGTAAGGGS
jgi:thioredoxin 2